MNTYMQNTLLHMSELRYSYTPTSYNAHGRMPQANAKHVGTLVSFFSLWSFVTNALSMLEASL